MTASAAKIERIRLSLQVGLASAAVMVGGAGFLWMVSSRPSPIRHAQFDRVPNVAVRVASPSDESAPVIGHGTVRAKSQISIVPQVSGTLTYVHPNLAQGLIVPKDTLLFQVDQAVYEARVQQALGEVKALEAALARHDQEAMNLAGQIETARQLQAIDENEYLTSKSLFEDEKVGTRRDLDATHQRFLRQKSAVAELESKQSIIPHVKLETTAQLEGSKARLKQAQLDLDATTIRCPFEARVESISAHQAQFVTAHLAIATLTDMEALEVSVGIDPRELRWLDAAARPESLGQGSAKSTFEPVVRVRWSLRGQEYVWKGRVTRFEKVDESTRTARMVVEVRKSEIAGLSDASEPTSPALSIGMFCTTELPSAPLKSALTVPRHAIYENQWVYVFVPDEGTEAAEDGTLERRRVPMLRAMGDEVLVDYADREGSEICELTAGDRIVVSKLTKPVVGMRLHMRSQEQPAVTQLAVRKMDRLASTAPVEAGLSGYRGDR